MDFWETVLCTFLASLLAIVLGGLYSIGAFRKRKPKEPPLDKGCIPWLGHAANFKKNPVEFLEKMRKKHGDIFTVLVGGNYMNYVADPHTYDSIMKESKDKLDFAAFGLTVVLNAFGIQATKSFHHIIKRISDKYLRGKSLNSLNQAMMEKLKDMMLRSQDAGDKKSSWKQDGVFHFSYKTIFQAAFLALFGTDPDQDVESKRNAFALLDEMFENFLKFDHFFPQMVFRLLDPLGKKETDRLRNYFWDFLSVEKMYCKDDIGPWVIEQDKQMAEVGMMEKMRTKFLLLLLWASQANTGPATFWILVYLLKYPDAMKAVREEVDGVLRETGQDMRSGSPLTNLSLDKIKTPLLDSAIEETLRLKVSAFLFRNVMQDTDIKMSDGKEYSLRKGDTLVLSPFLGLQMDPEIHPDPQTFKYDRFVKQDGLKREFFKNGKKLKLHSMPFGGGSSMCPGRFFAVSEMKMFLILMLAYFDMELVDAEEEIPPLDNSRFGLGTAQPSHDIQFKYQLRVYEAQ